MRKKSFIVVLLPLVIAVTGCASLDSKINSALMPERIERTYEKMPWNSYRDLEQMKEEQLRPGVTTRADLERLGLNPYAIPNTLFIRDVRDTLVPSGQQAGIERLGPAAKACYENFEVCKGYRYHFAVVKVKGEGSLILRLLQMKKIDRTTGWDGDLDVYLLPRRLYPSPRVGTQNMSEEILAFALVGGRPAILKVERRESPLAPLLMGVDLGRGISGFPVPKFGIE